jgi:transposase
MLIIGCDFHTRYQQIAMAEDSTGELLAERRLDHESGEAEAFYRSLPGAARVGIEATGPIHWFVRLLAELGHELVRHNPFNPRPLISHLTNSNGSGNL